jgi:hypothetical protein
MRPGLRTVIEVLLFAAAVCIVWMLVPGPVLSA